MWDSLSDFYSSDLDNSTIHNPENRISNDFFYIVVILKHTFLERDGPDVETTRRAGVMKI